MVQLIAVTKAVRVASLKKRDETTNDVKGRVRFEVTFGNIDRTDRVSRVREFESSIKQRFCQ